jgi:hypothetical protein
MHLKVYGGTVTHGDSSLCNTCRHSTIIRGRSLEEKIVECRASMMRSLRIPFKVTSCTTYDDSRLPSYTDLLQSAWILQPRSRRRPAGFIHARELNSAELQAVMSELEGDDE